MRRAAETVKKNGEANEGREMLEKEMRPGKTGEEWKRPEKDG